MKNLLRIWTLTVLIFILAVASASAGVLEYRAAMKRWYPQNILSPQPFWGVTFDGSNIWAEWYQGPIYKISATDGTILGTYDVGSGQFMTFDGTNIWLCAGGNLVKIRANDGIVLGTYSVGGGAPNSILFDGTNIWVTTNTGHLVKEIPMTEPSWVLT